MTIRALCLALTLAVSGLAAPPDWRTAVRETIPLYGHRNWIVIADSAYPDQSAPGIQTIVSGADQISVLQFVLQALKQSKHVSPEVYTDKELEFLDEKDAPGIDVYRDQLKTMLTDITRNSLPHEQLIRMLDAVSRDFHVLLIKTNLTLPYTSVFLQLDCAYWPPDAEKRLRARMSAAQKP